MFLLGNGILTVIGLINSIINYQQAEMYPFGIPFKAQIVRFLAIFSLTVYKVALVTFVTSNAFYMHPVAYVATSACIWLCNRIIYRETMSVTTVFLPAMVPAFQQVNGNYGKGATVMKKYGGVLKTIIHETIGFVVYGSIGLVSRKYNLFNEIKVPESDNKNYFYWSKTLFNKFLVNYDLPQLLLYSSCLWGIYIILMIIYYKFCDPYHMMRDSQQSIQDCSQERLEMPEKVPESVCLNDNEQQEGYRESCEASLPRHSKPEKDIGSCDNDASICTSEVVQDVTNRRSVDLIIHCDNKEIGDKPSSEVEKVDTPTSDHDYRLNNDNMSKSLATPSTVELEVINEVTEIDVHKERCGSHKNDLSATKPASDSIECTSDQNKETTSD